MGLLNKLMFWKKDEELEKQKQEKINNRIEKLNQTVHSTKENRTLKTEPVAQKKENVSSIDTVRKENLQSKINELTEKKQEPEVTIRRFQKSKYRSFEEAEEAIRKEKLQAKLNGLDEAKKEEQYQGVKRRTRSKNKHAFFDSEEDYKKHMAKEEAKHKAEQNRDLYF